ncbi:MAG: ATP-binding protein [Planctomycetes bacterium]|nr:ATP-binding protein [Planctomycetota bacterium]
MNQKGRWIVITGGPYSGKTSLLERLASRGFRTLPEAAIRVIDALNTELGVEGQRTWRLAHAVDFQDRVAREQELQERGLQLRDGEVLFADRGLPDSIGYCRYKGVEPPRWLVEATREKRYTEVLLLDTLSTFDRRLSSGRTSTYEDSLRIRDHLRATYEELGYPVLSVPELPIGERDAFALRLLSLSDAR